MLDVALPYVNGLDLQSHIVPQRRVFARPFSCRREREADEAAVWDVRLARASTSPR